MLGLADPPEPVVGEPDPVAAREEEPARAVLADGMARVDMVGQLEIYGIAPRPLDPVGPDDVAGVRRGLHRNIEEIAALVPDQLRRPDRADVAGEGGGDRPPVHQVAAMPDDEAGIGIEGREGHVIIGAILEDGRIGMVAGDDRVEEGAVAEIRLALAFESLSPTRRRGAGALGEERRRKEDRRSARQGPGERGAAVNLHARTGYSFTRAPNRIVRPKW